jgi:geranylgeranylglycerol-phosphate geranylgeranyltransferase
MAPRVAFGVASRGFWSGYAVTLRPYLCFVSGAAGLVGLALTSLAPAPLAAAFAAFFLSYGLGQALTDVFQRDTDALSAPYRPLVRGEIAPGAVLAVSLAGLAACSAVFFALDARTLLLAAAAVIGLATYTPLKRRWWGGPAWNAWIMALLPAIGVLCGGPGPLAAAPLAAACTSVFFTYAVFVLLGYLKDVEADRATGYLTLPVRFGRPTTVAVSAACAVIGLVASSALVLAIVPSPSWALGLALWATGAVELVLAHERSARARTDAEAYPGIAFAVRGFVALHLGEAALLRPSLALPALALTLLLEAALAARPCREQV